jgi:hypothetical protein
MKPKFKFFSVAVLSIFLASCEKEYYYTPAPLDPTVPVSFTTEVVPIFTTSCLGSGCHGTGGIAPILTADKAYSELTTKGYVVDSLVIANNPLYVSMTSTTDPMPPDGILGSDKIDKVKTWIIQGYKNN